MSGNGDQSTDGESIKPVSSLRAQFEGLQFQETARNAETKEPLRTPRTAERLDVGPGSESRKASLDLPRPASPWSVPKNNGVGTILTPGDQRTRGLSPPKSSHKRPLSMQMHGSPKMTPSVIIESPRSPPKGYFSTRTPSPERVVAKVRDLISQHSSRSSTRPGTPHAEVEPAVRQGHTDSKIPKQEPVALKPVIMPPPVNRAEKPKIPAKPAPLVAQDLAGLVPQQQPRKASIDAKVSPFSTPPSSDESPSGESAPTIKSTKELSERLRAAARRTSPQRDAMTPEQPLRPSDPRMMGFMKPVAVTERRDPRSMGLSTGPARPPSRDNSAIPGRANTVSDRPSRDPRELGLSAGRSAPRHVSENLRQTPPTHLHHPVPQRQNPVRDPRQYGFSNHANQSPIAEEAPPSLPLRNQNSVPPPRPSEGSKRPASRSRKPPSPPAPIDRSTKPPTIRHVPSPIIRPPSTGAFLPPPRRNTFDPPDSPTARAVPDSPKRSQSIATDRRMLEEDSDDAEGVATEPTTFRTEYPDLSQSNRRPPKIRRGLHELHTKSDTKVFDISGQYLCTGGFSTKVFNLLSGEQIMGLNHGETVKVLSVAFKPALERDSEGSRIWIGNSSGELLEIDIATHSTVATSTVHNGRAVLRIIRSKRDMWTLDDEGKLFVWRADESGVPNLKYSHIPDRVPKGHTFSLAVQEKLWLATGKEIRVYRPGKEPSAVLTKPLLQPSTGEITSGTSSSQNGGQVYFGHADGKVTIYSSKDYTWLATVKASDYKINGLAFVGDWLWAAYKTGKVYVYDTSVTPWKVKKDWRAHDGPAAGMILDPSSVWTLNRLQVTTLGQNDNHVRLWDGMLEDDWLETTMQERDAEYCSFREVRAAVVTWNVGAIIPDQVRSDFIADAIHAEDPPEILAFGFQEVVDLEDRAVTAKSILGFGKKKDVVKTEQHQSRVYREWRDYLSRCINKYTRYAYSELCTSSLVGLFQCVFIRQEQRGNVQKLSANDVKCGMKGRYGNKGALITRFVLDDSSICFVNCHLAAGQTQTSHRNNDVATILEAESLLPERDPETRSSLFVGGGDGTQILDHEICILNGDLNYRIDAMPQKAVIDQIKRGDYTKLLERDQLMICRRRVSGFRLSPFTELPITFAPTYKYDPGTDDYDSSEKKRAPAWCDRLLYRGPGRVKQIEYRRHDVRDSDHRPVSGVFKLRIKTIDRAKRVKVREKAELQFADVKRRLAEEASVEYLVGKLGVGEDEARALIIKNG
jgi:hypothetical protein